MENLKLIGTSLCITALLTSLFSMLIPKLKLKSTVSMAVSLFFLASLVSPFLSGNLKLSLPTVFSYRSETPPPVSNAVSKQFLSLAESKLEANLTKVLQEMKINPKEIQVEINIDEDNSISINKLKIVLEKGDAERKDVVISKIKSETGVAPEVLS